MKIWEKYKRKFEQFFLYARPDATIYLCLSLSSPKLIMQYA